MGQLAFLSNNYFLLAILIICFILYSVAIFKKSGLIEAISASVILTVYIMFYSLIKGISPVYIVMLVLSLVLASIEIFIPGFGIFGILSIICFSLSLFGIKNIDEQSFVMISIFVLLLIIEFIYAVKKGMFSSKFNKLILFTNHEDYKKVELDKETILYKEGFAISDLRPVGFIVIEDKKYDAIAYKDYIKKNERVKVISVDGITAIVDRIGG